MAMESKIRKPNASWTLSYPNSTLQDLLIANSAKFKRKEAAYYGGIDYSWQYIDAFSNAFANVLWDIGVSRGTRVAVMLPNIPQLVITLFGIWKAGCTAVLLDPWLGEKDLQPRIMESDARIAVTLSDVVLGYDVFHKIEAIRDTSRIEHVMVTSMTDAWSSLTNAFKVLRGVKPIKRENTIDWLAVVRKKFGKKPPESSVYPDDVALIHFVGPLNNTKMIELTHRNIVSNALQFSYALNMQEDDVVLGVSPLYHPYILIAAYISTLFNGAKIVLIPLITSYALKLVGERQPDFVRAITKHNVTLIVGTQNLFRALSVFADRADQFSKVRAAVCLPTPPSDDLKTQFQKVSGLSIISGYATYEGIITHLENNGTTSSGSIGKPLPDTEAAVFNLQDKDLPIEMGQLGVLGVRGPQFSGLYPTQTRKRNPLNSSGWILTGDFVKKEASDNYVYVEPAEDVVVTSGHRVWKTELEQVLMAHPSIKSCKLHVIDDPFSDTGIAAQVVSKGNRLSQQDLLEYLIPKLAIYKIPVRIDIE
jgi:long-chain acyl-CoA synthetase